MMNSFNLDAIDRKILGILQNRGDIGRHLRGQNRRPEHIRGDRPRGPAEDDTLRHEEHHDERDERDADPPVEAAVPRKAGRCGHRRLLHTRDVAEVLRMREKN